MYPNLMNPSVYQLTHTPITTSLLNDTIHLIRGYHTTTYQVECYAGYSIVYNATLLSDLSM